MSLLEFADHVGELLHSENQTIGLSRRLGY
jgi:hypothetical protein